MALTADVIAEVRRRAAHACEFCGVSEIDVGGELTIDHFRPTSKGGTDELENLLYCCSRCNLYRQAYWPEASNSQVLWNPRQEPASKHFVELTDGNLLPLTDAAAFTIRRLRLNRVPLVNWRLNRRQREIEQQLLDRYQQLTATLEQLNGQLEALMQVQQALLREQNELLRYLLEE